MQAIINKAAISKHAHHNDIATTSFVTLSIKSVIIIIIWARSVLLKEHIEQAVLKREKNCTNSYTGM